MKKAGRRFHRIFRAVFAAALALAITGANLAPAAAVTWADVNELKDEANGLDAEKKELQVSSSYNQLSIICSPYISPFG